MMLVKYSEASSLMVPEQYSDACKTKDAGIDPLVTSRKELLKKVFKRCEALVGEEFMIDVVHKLYEGLQMEESDQGKEEINEMIYVISSS